MDLQAFAAQAVTDGIVSGFDIMHMPEIYNKLVGNYPRQKDLMFLQEMGSYKEVKQTNYSWTEENRLNAPITIAAKTTVVPNVTVRITLSPQDHYSSGAYSYVRVNDRLEFRNGAKALVIAKNETVPGAHTIDVQTVNAANYDPVAAAVVGQSVGIFSMGFAEGAKGYSESILPKVTSFNAKVQIFRETFKVTTSEQGNGTWMEFTWPAGYPNAGQTGSFYFIKAEGDTYDRFMFKRELGLLTNDEDDGKLIIGNDPAIRQTRGFIPHVKRYGELMDYATKPSMVVFETMQRLLNKNFREKDNMLLMGLDFDIALTSFAVDLVKNGGVLYNTGDGRPMDSVALGFRQYEFSTGYKFHCKGLQALNSADTTGLPGFNYSGLAILCPTANKQVTTDAGQKEKMAPITIRYKKPIGGGQQQGWYKMWFTGAGADTPTNDELNRQCNIASEEGMQVMGAKGFIYCSKAA